MFGLKSKLPHGGPIAHRQETGGFGAGSTCSQSTGLAFGLVAETRVATAMGWRAVEAIAQGDLVMTFDRGLQPVRDVTRGVNWGRSAPCPDHLRPLSVPTGALGNKEKMALLPEQTVLVESDTADVLFGDPFALVAASDLEGFRGIERLGPDVEMDVIQLHFDCDEVVFVNLGALAFCPSTRMLGIDTILGGDVDDPVTYRSLPSAEAVMLIEGLTQEDAIAENTAPATAGLQAAAFA